MAGVNFISPAYVVNRCDVTYGHDRSCVGGHYELRLRGPTYSQAIQPRLAMRSAPLLKPRSTCSARDGIGAARSVRDQSGDGRLSPICDRFGRPYDWITTLPAKYSDLRPAAVTNIAQLPHPDALTGRRRRPVEDRGQGEGAEPSARSKCGMQSAPIAVARSKRRGEAGLHAGLSADRGRLRNVESAFPRVAVSPQLVQLA